LVLIMNLIIVGAGIFGVTAAIELRARGHQVTLLDPGPLPHPLAASTDISKVVRMEYGPDADYMALAERSLAGWRAWNQEFGVDLFHETGVLYLKPRRMRRGDYEYESWRLLRARGHAPERMDSKKLREQYPAWNADYYVDGFYNPEGGFAESSRVVARLLERATSNGIQVREGNKFVRLDESEGHVRGVILDDDARVPAERVVVAAGAWTPYALPFLGAFFRTVGQPVFHLKPQQPELYESARFPVFSTTATNGYYGFPVNRDGVLKISNHGNGREMAPESPERQVTSAEESALRAFLAESVPSLAEAPIVYTRVCLYTDTRDENFWIAPDPERPGLVVATGGSGHAFKFAPVLGGIIADAVEEKSNPLLDKFRWRPGDADPQEAARYRK
jgi:glycine/D-amino acid oxidase-like deaminating enzyme